MHKKKIKIIHRTHLNIFFEKYRQQWWEVGTCLKQNRSTTKITCSKKKTDIVIRTLLPVRTSEYTSEIERCPNGIPRIALYYTRVPGRRARTWFCASEFVTNDNDANREGRFLHDGTGGNNIGRFAEHGTLRATMLRVTHSITRQVRVSPSPCGPRHGGFTVYVPATRRRADNDGERSDSRDCRRRFW